MSFSPLAARKHSSALHASSEREAPRPSTPPTLSDSRSLFLPLQVARHAANKVRSGGTLLFMGGTGGRRTAKGFALISALTAAMPALVKNLAVEVAPVRVNLIAAGFVDTRLSASLLGDQLNARREQ